MSRQQRGNSKKKHDRGWGTRMLFTAFEHARLMEESQLRVEMKRVRGEIRDVLNPEQQAKFDELLRNRPRRAEGLGTNRFRFFPKGADSTNSNL